MRLSGTVTEIGHLEDDGVTTLTFLGSSIRLPGVDFLCVVHSDHALEIFLHYRFFNVA